MPNGLWQFFSQYKPLLFFIVIGTVVVVFVIVIVALTQALGKGTARQYFPGLFNVVYFPNDECTAKTTTGAILGDMVGGVQDIAKS